MNPVGAAVRRFDLLAKAECQAITCWMCRPFREQARSHREMCLASLSEYGLGVQDRLAFFQGQGLQGDAFAFQLVEP